MLIAADVVAPPIFWPLTSLFPRKSLIQMYEYITRFVTPTTNTQRYCYTPSVRTPTWEYRVAYMKPQLERLIRCV